MTKRRNSYEPQEITLLAAIELFLGDYRPSTARSYAFVLDFVRDYIGPDRPLARIEPTHLVEFVQSVGDRPNVKSPATLNKYIKTLKTFFNWCVRMKFLKESPAAPLKRRPMGEGIRRDKAMTDAEYQKLLEFAKWHPRNHALVLFLGDTGCRAGGAAGVRIQDFNFDNNTAVVTEKGDKTRVVWFGSECAAAIQTWIKRRRNAVGPYVFSLHGDLVQSAEIGRVVRRMCQKVGVRSLGSHSLRHRKGHQLADARTAPTIAATALGHESVTTTLNHYYPRDDQRAEKIMRRLTHGFMPGDDEVAVAAEIEQQEPGGDPALKIITGINFRAG